MRESINTREIKFRAWDNVNKRFARSSTYCRDDGQLLASADPNGVQMDGSQKVVYRKQYEFAGQFTGLKDKNGVEMYFDDIVTLTDYSDDEVFQVTQDDFGIPCFVSPTKFGLMLTFEAYFLSPTTRRDAFEIVGNSMEHPHLLK